MIYNKLSTIVTLIKCVLVVLVLFCVGVAIHYLCVCLPRHLEIRESNTYYQNMGVDYLGLIVAIFAVIVTILVTWQIITNLNVRQELKAAKEELKEEKEKYITECNKLSDKIEIPLSELKDRFAEISDCCETRKQEIKDLKIEINRVLDNVMIVVETEFAEIYKNLITGEDELGREFRYLNHRIQSLIHASKINDVYGCNLVVMATNESIKNSKAITMTRNSKKELIEGLLQVQNPDKIIGFEELRKNLESISIRHNAKGL